MLNRIHIQNFRSFRDIEIGPFKRINLIAGLNNAGKTGLLEAIFLALQEEMTTRVVNLPNLFRVFSSEADWNETFWRWLSRDKSPSTDVKIEISNENGRKEGIVLTQEKRPQIQQQAYPGFKNLGNLGPFHFLRRGAPTLSFSPAVFASHPSDPVQDAIDYNRVIVKRAKKRVEELLRRIDPRLQAIEALQTGQRPLIYADVGLSEMIPVGHLGEGFCRLLDIYSEILAGEAKVLLIDELENGLHHSVLPVVWKGLITAARELDVQIFTTTHSAECIFAARSGCEAKRAV